MVVDTPAFDQADTVQSGDSGGSRLGGWCIGTCLGFFSAEPAAIAAGGGKGNMSFLLVCTHKRMLLLASLGVPEEAVRNAGEWRLGGDALFQRLLLTPLRKIICKPLLSPMPQDSGIVKGNVLVEVKLYRDITKPLPPTKQVEVAEEQEQQQQQNLSYSTNRTLKLWLTDGIGEFPALEYEPCAALDLVRIGAKLKLTDVYYVNGILLLTPKTIQFIGAPSSLENWNEPIAPIDVIELL